MRPIQHILATLKQPLHITEARRPISVCEERILASHVAHPMGDTPAFAPVLLQRHDPEYVVQLVLLGKVQRHLHGPVLAAVVDDEDLVPADLLGRRVARMSHAARADGVLGTFGATNVLVQPVYRLLQGGDDAVLLIICWEHYAQIQLGWIN
jgi:hypothetical protein